MSFFDSLETERYDRQYTDKQLTKRMFAYFRPHKRRLVAISVLLVFLSISGAALPWIVARGIDLLSQDLRLQNILLIGGAILTIGVGNWFTNWLRRRLTVRVIGDTVLALRNDAFRASAEHDLSFYDEFSSGRIVSRITSDTNEFGQLVLLITDLISEFAQAIILGGVLISIDWRLSLYLFGFLPVLFLSAQAFRNLARKVTRRGMRAMANVNAEIKETVSGIAIAKNFRQETSIFKEFDEANRQSFRVNV
jgi:ATP-binding cassette subfamily B protein